MIALEILNALRAKGKAYGREEDLWRGLDQLEAPPSESPRDSGDAAQSRVLVSSTATPMQTGGDDACQECGGFCLHAVLLSTAGTA